MAKIEFQDGVIHYTEGSRRDMKLNMRLVVMDSASLFMYSYALDQLYQTGDFSLDELSSIGEKIIGDFYEYGFFIHLQLVKYRLNGESSQLDAESRCIFSGKIELIDLFNVVSVGCDAEGGSKSCFQRISNSLDTFLIEGFFEQIPEVEYRRRENEQNKTGPDF